MKKWEVAINSPDELPHEGRSILDVGEWVLVKEAIDAGREDNNDLSAMKTLQYYGLWDDFKDIPDEKKINELYNRYA